MVTLKKHEETDFLYLREVSEISKKIVSVEKYIQIFKLSFSSFQSNKHSYI